MANTPSALKIPQPKFPDNPTPEQLRDIAYVTGEALKRKMRDKECPEEWLKMGFDYLFPESMTRH